MENKNTEESNCPICTDDLEDCTHIKFNQCNHKFCQSCAGELVFNDKLKCPLDRILFEEIGEVQPNKTIINKSIDEYRYDTIIREQQSMEQDFENTLSYLLNSFINAMNSVFTNFCNMDEIFDESLDDGSKL